MSGLEWIVICCTLLFSIGSLIYMQSKRIQQGSNRKEKVVAALPDTRKKTVYFIIMLIVNILISTYLIKFYPERSVLFVVKRICLLSVLWPVAFIDYQQHIIPNKLLIVALAYRTILVIFEFIFERNNIWATVVSELLAAVILFAVCMLFLLVLRGGIGMGDVKLLIVMALFIGIESIFNVVMMSFIVLFLVSICLLITKKVKKKDAVAFGPSVLVGTVITIMMTGA